MERQFTEEEKAAAYKEWLEIGPIDFSEQLVDLIKKESERFHSMANVKEIIEKLNELDRDPNTPGLYGALINDQRWNPDCFSFAYWDGKYWILPTQSDLSTAPRRGRPTWCKLKIGTDWNGID